MLLSYIDRISYSFQASPIVSFLSIPYFSFNVCIPSLNEKKAEINKLKNKIEEVKKIYRSTTKFIALSKYSVFDFF